MIQKPFDSITKDDIDSLIDNAVSEGTSLDYKEELIEDKPEKKKEFLFDVASFANAGRAAR